ncbi:class I SAM-dependent methyltransferase [Chloroflexota bacterium]
MEKRIGMKHTGNLYDDVQLDIEEAHRNFIRHNNRVFKKRNFYLTGLLVKSGLWKRMIDSGFIRDWFDEFKDYWINCLGCRPLNLHDFFWLYSYYRTKFQIIAVSEDANTQEFMRAWQHPENIYSTFAAVYKNALSPLSFYRKYIKNTEHILEYGCGVAPITYSALKYGNFKNAKFTIADIGQFTYHFAKWRLSSYNNVAFIDIYPNTLPDFPNKFDAVFLMGVLEHLPNPLEVVSHLYQNMKDGRYLIFDYIKSEGCGLDTMESVKEREQVLDFIEKNFELIEGKV